MKRVSTKALLVLHEIYLDYVNNFCSVERFAEYYGLSFEFATSLIKEAKRLHEEE